ncbi:MAG TPA: SAM-dependent methyltransferase, partial [Candidatus Melainabacteria bacterium]|nr:SAM-dependent methyltransferase [Candidatus Melainabacteria bacterium]
MKKEKISEAESIRLWQANAEAWTELTRMGFDICRDHLNMPNFLSILPSVTGQEGLDIGCG